jgi:hypothetical protein
MDLVEMLMEVPVGSENVDYKEYCHIEDLNDLFELYLIDIGDMLFNYDTLNFDPQKEFVSLDTEHKILESFTRKELNEVLEPYRDAIEKEYFASLDGQI